MTSKKDYVEMAKIINDLLHNDAIRISVDNKVIVAEIARHIAKLFTDNPRFDSERFYLACGLTTDGTVAA